MSTLAEMLAVHEAHDWKQVGLCVYCTDCHVRLYQGDLPTERDPGRADRQAACDHDWDFEFGAGLFGICDKCGLKEWTV